MDGRNKLTPYGVSLHHPCTSCNTNELAKIINIQSSLKIQHLQLFIMKWWYGIFSYYPTAVRPSDPALCGSCPL